MRYHFESEQWLPYSVPHVFAFFSNPDNLPRLMPDWQQARITQATLVPPPGASPTANTAGAGSRMTLTFRPIPFSPVRLAWDAEIDEFAWNDHFCDLQLRGPFAYWHHCHRVTPQSRNGVAGTLLRDELAYEVPLGLLGRFVHKLAVRSQIGSIFAFRHRRTEELLRS